MVKRLHLDLTVRLLDPQLVDTTIGPISFVDYGPHNGRAVLLLHGVGGSWRNWAAVMSSLKGEARCVAIDLPGFGESKPTRAALSSENVVDGLRQLCDRLSLVPDVIVGHSLGAVVASHFAVLAELPPATALVLVSPPAPALVRKHGLSLEQHAILTGMSASPMLRRAGLLSNSIFRVPGLGRVVLKYFVSSDRMTSELRDFVFSDLGNGPVREVLRAASPHDLRQIYEQLHHPVSVIFGEADRLITESNAYDVVELVKPMRTSRVVAGHWLIVETPDVVANEVRCSENV